MKHDWRDSAACKDTDPDDWFPETYSAAHETKMARICFFECPVQENCLEYALNFPETVGMWAGFSQAELKGIRTKRFSRCKHCQRRWPKARLTFETTCRYCKFEAQDRKKKP